MRELQQPLAQSGAVFHGHSDTDAPAAAERFTWRSLDPGVPPAPTGRPKRGFGVPIGTWLRGPLRDWAESLLDPHPLSQGGLLCPHAVHSLWDQHVSQWRDRKEVLWSLLMFQAWWETWQSAEWNAVASPPRNQAEPNRISS